MDRELVQQIAEQIRMQMGRKRMSIRRLAMLTKTPYTTMYAYCHGFHTIPPRKLQQIADALGVPVRLLTESKEVAHV